MIIQYEINPKRIVEIIFFEKNPIIIAIIKAITLGSLYSTKNPELFKNTAGKIIAGKTAEGTYVSICLVFFPILLGLIINIEPNLVK